MKNPLILVPLGLALGCHAALCQGTSHIDFDTSAIYESYDKNPLGEMVDKPTGGYGVVGNYIFQGGSASVAKQAFQVVEGGLAFGSYSSAAGRAVQVNALEGTGVGILVDGGKAWGDTDLHWFDQLYCSYLVNFTQASNTTGSRAEVRTSTASSGGDQFQIHADGSAVLDNGSANSSGNSLIQPALAYKGTAYSRVQDAAKNDLKLNTTYMMIGRFNNAGNVLSATPTGTWNIGDTTITVNSSSNLQIGQLVSGAGIAENSMVKSISGTAVTLNLPTTAAGSATALNFTIIRNEIADAMADYAPPAAGQTSTIISPYISTGNIKVGMVATGPGIPLNTVVTEVAANPLRVTVNAAVTATVDDGSIIFRSMTPLTATWSSGSQDITLNVNPGIQIGNGVFGAGIAESTLVQSVSGNVITLNKPTTAAGAGTVVHFNERTASCSLFALSEAQYAHMITLASQSAKDGFLDTAPIGTGAQNVTVRIIGTPTTTGSIEFGQGRYVHLIAAGRKGTTSPPVADSPQVYKMDELRFGFTLRSVTQPAAMLPVPADDPAAFDDSTRRSWYGYDNGYGWKSGYYLIEETASTQGAQLFNVVGYPAEGSSPSNELTPGSMDHTWIIPRTATNTDQGTRRRPDPAVVDMSKPYTASFDFRLLSSNSTFTAFEDRIQFGADSQVTSTGAMTVGTNVGPNPTRANVPTAGGNNLTWMAGVVGASPAGRELSPNRWFFYDFKGISLQGSDPPNYFVGGNMVVASDDSDSDPAPNTDQIPSLNTGSSTSDGNGIFSFKFEVNPQTYTYRGTITYRPRNDSTGSVIKTFTKGGLKFRDNFDATTLFWGISKSANENRYFALDNVRVAPGVDFFPDWVGSYTSISASGDKLRGADPDSDGRKNFLEYALDGDPSSQNGHGKEIHGVTTIGANKYHTITVPVRNSFSFSAAASPNTGDLESNYTKNEGLRYRIEGSYDLANWNATVVEVTPAIAPAAALSVNPGYVYKTFRLAQPITTSQPKGFLRVMVESTK